MRRGPLAPKSLLRDLVALLKPGIVVSNLLTAAAGWTLAFALSGGGPASLLPLVAGVAALVAGSAALNNWIDRDIDALMIRTRDRPTATGRLGRASVLSLGLGLVLAGLLALFFTGPLPALLGLLGCFVYLVPYSLWSKRKSALSSLVGGIAGALPPLIGWAAVDARLSGPALLLFAYLVVWQQSHVRALAERRAADFVAAGLPLAGLPSPSESGADRPFSGKAPRRGIACWIAALLPFPALVAQALPGGPGAAFATGESLAILLWLVSSLAARGPRRGTLLFFASLAVLSLFFAGLLALALLR